MSRQGLWLEWLKAASVPIAILSVFVTGFLGMSQLNHAVQTRIDERLDKAATRLASDKEAERISGVAGLRLLISETRPDPGRQGAALQFLINALAMESSPIVQSTIFDALRTIKSGDVSQAVLDGGLATAIERNRNLTATIASAIEGLREQRWRERLSQTTGRDFAGMDGPLQAGEIDSVPLEAYRETLSPPTDFTAALALDQRTRLQGLAKAVAMLTRSGGQAVNYSAIYCEDCDLSQARLDGADFRDAFLKNATFAHAHLAGANFRNADLGGTGFFGADMSKSDLTWTLSAPSSALHKNVARHAGDDERLPILECTDLRGADLTGRPLVWLDMNSDDPDHLWIRMSSAALRRARMDKTTRLKALGVMGSTWVTDARMSTLSEAKRRDWQSSVKANQAPVILGLYDPSGEPTRARLQEPPAGLDAFFTHTIVTNAHLPDIQDLGMQRAWATKLLTRFLGQASWASTSVPSSLRARDPNASEQGVATCDGVPNPLDLAFTSSIVLSSTERAEYGRF